MIKLKKDNIETNDKDGNKECDNEWRNQVT